MIILLCTLCIMLCGAIIQSWFSCMLYCALCCAERSSNDDPPIYTVHYVVRSDRPMMILLYIPCIMLCGAIIQWWFSYIYRALCCAERSSSDDSPIYTVHYVVRSDHPMMILLYSILRSMLCGAIIQWWFSNILVYRALCCAERSSNDDSPIYIYRSLCCAERSSNDDSPIYVVCASILLPLSGPLSQRAVAVLVCV
jgi:hypothetical protein